MITIEFFGVRGSTPCSCRSTAGVGGNTSCVVLHCGDDDPIILDLGTGVRYLGEHLDSQNNPAPFRGTALVTHLHWDHVQGLPFFIPMLSEDAELTLVGPSQESGSLQEAVEAFVCPPLFPIDLRVLPGSVDFVESCHTELNVGNAKVMVRPVEHIGATNGYRINFGSGSVAYIPDHQEPEDGSREVSETVLELCQGVDVLIHDAQYNVEEFGKKSSWGHSTIDYAAEVARQSGAKRLVLFHHDPSHSDEWVGAACGYVAELADGAFDVVAASEKMVLISGEVTSTLERVEV